MKIPKMLVILLCLSTCGLLIDSRPAGAGLGYGYGHGYYSDADLIDETPPQAPILYKGNWNLEAKPHPLFLAAEKELKKKNFRKAERKYNRFIKAAPKHIDVPQATFQRARALFKLSSFDEALKLLNDFLASKPGLLWEARCRKVLSELYNQMPQYAFRRGKKLKYNREHREGQQIYVWNYNRHKTARELETARLAYMLLASASHESAGAKKDWDLFQEAMDNNLALVKAVQGRGGRLWDGFGKEQDIQPPKKGAEYDFAWPERTKVIFLLEEVDRQSVEKKRSKLVIESRHQKAVFLMGFPEMPPVEWQKKTQKSLEKCNKARKNGDPICLPEVFVPGPRLDPLQLVESIVRDYPKGPHLDRALGTTARILESRHRFLQAEELYEQLIKQYPKSKYTGDAKESLYALRRRWISVHSNTVFAPGKKREVTITARNVKTVTFDAYEVNLKKALANPGALSDPHRRFVDFEKNFGRAKAAKKWFGRKVASWKYAAKDQDDHVRTMGSTEIPFDKTGAYLVRAKGGEEQHVFLVVLTDRVLVGKQDRGKVHYWITDAISGQPAAGTNVLVKETYWLNNSHKVRIGRYKTDENGRVTHKMVKFRYASSSNVEALVHDGKRFAFSNRQYCWSRGRGRTYDQNRIFTITDRPVYRPGDKVHFKLIVRGYHKGKNENVPGVRVRVKMSNPRGEILYDQTRKTDKYGTLHGTVKMDQEATLGVYRVNSWVEKGYGSYQSSGSNFRVEEYKKPEFKVTVTPSAPDTRLGTKVKAHIQGRYYFGAPVAHAKVQYQIYRQPYWHVHYPPSRYDWLYGQGYGIVYERPFEQGTGQELVQDGHGTTDEAGKLQIELPSSEKDAKHDYLYTVQVQMTDLSRRTIHGKGEVKVTKDPFHIFARTQAGFFSPGDQVEIEVEALTPQDRPVQARGTWTVYRLTYSIGEKEKAEKLSSHSLKTDAAGRTFVHWKAPQVGHYRVVFSLRQAGGPAVKQKHYLYVTEGRFDPGRFKFQKITLKTEKRTYLRGEKIRLMVGIPKAGGSIWLSQEGGDEIFEEQVLRLEGTGAVIEIPADETRAPNFFARVTYIDDGEIFTAQHEVFIPPGEEILNVTLKPDKATHRPGEKGKFKVTVTDHQGKPVKGQLNLSVFDESVLYIQGDTTGDIRPYYYGNRRYLGLWLDNSLQIWHLASHWLPKPPRFKLGGLPRAGTGWFPYYGQYNLGLNGVGYGGGGWGYGRGGGGYYMRGNREARLSLQSSPHSVAVTGALSDMVSMGEASGADARFAAKKPADATAVVRGPAASAAPVTVREFFADTALWIPALETDDQGRATVELEYPDSVTTWKGRAFVVDQGRKVGMASVSVVTTKRLVARIETPRFMVEGDRLTLAAVIHNGFDKPLAVDVRLQLKGIELASNSELRLTIPPHSDMRHDFTAYARRAGQAEVRLIAASAEESDALLKTLPVLEWGSEKLVTAAGTLKKPGEIDLKLNLPEERKKKSTTLTIEASPSLGGVLLRSLPYLIRYPYGCIEQTISRFVPAAVVARTLKDAGVKLEQLKPVRGQASMARHLGKLPWYQAVRSTKQLEDVIRRGLRLIASMQNPDGGFGWFSGTESDPYMTAYAIMGLHEAKVAGHPVNEAMLRRAVECLHAQKEDLKATHLGVFVAYAVGLENRPMPDLIKRAYGIRDKFSPYGQSLLALALYNAGMKSRARQVAENLADLAWVDEANNTATFKAPAQRWWLWWFNRVEATAWALRALVKIQPDHPHVDRLATWLLRNRSGNRWTNTKDTSMAVLALTRYMDDRGELDPNATITVFVNDRKIKSFRATKKTVLGLSGTMVIPDEALKSGPVNVKVKLSGRGQVYATAFLEYFTKEKKITGSGYEIGVKRSYSRLIPKKGTRKTWTGKIQVREYERAPLKDGDHVKSGDMIEVRLAIDSKNDYTYLVFEDFKPAGTEAVALKSGGEYAHGTWMYRELRDEKVVHFLCSLPQGTQVLTYRLRAEIPGTFRVLPHRAHAMYAPRIKAISDSGTLGIID